MQHNNRLHAHLSASGSSRWLNCPGSVEAEKNIKGSFNSFFAEEGTLAHELSEFLLRNPGKNFKTIEKFSKIEEEMEEFINQYVNYVLSYKRKDLDLFVETKVNFSSIVPNGFGTLDAGIMDNATGCFHIFDLKYGKGVKVEAFDNSQAQLYCLGILQEFEFLYNIEKFNIHIIQPRIQNFSSWEISVEDLLSFGETVKEKAALALSSDAPRIPGTKQCQWCKAKGDCPALLKFSEDMILSEFSEENFSLEISKLTPSQKKLILDNKNLIESFLEAVKENVYNSISSGEEFYGYKIVEGRSNRIWIDQAEETLFEELGEEAYTKKLIGLGKAEALLGKEKIKDLVFKPPGKLALVPDTDKREPISFINIENKFEDLK